MPDNYDYYLPNVIELIGYANNHISQAKELCSDLSDEWLEKLSQAYHLLEQVQEYLYSS